MKKNFVKSILFVSLSALVFCACGIVAIKNNGNAIQTNALTKPTNIDLKDNSEDEIREYWSYLDDLPASERRGTNLLKNLKYIMVNNPSNPERPAQYFSYSVCREIYEITDRNWVKAPASEIAGYDEETNTITGFKYGENPYLYYYYRNDNYTNPHRAEDKVSPVDGEGTPQAILNQEHLWSKSHGFSEKQNAGSDLHHLVAGDQAVNKWAHSNHSYGYVENEDSGWAASRVKWGENNALLGNKKGNPLHTDSQDESATVFEPRDEDKGDIARALFYMAARYNYFGIDETQASESEPDLLLVDHVISNDTTQVCDGTNGPAQYGKLSDLLEWAKLDPVDVFSDEGMHEVHRNNLIYNNFQYTRNPFIDFPEWIDYIWGDKAETGIASPATDTINGYNEETTECYEKITSLNELTSGRYIIGSQYDDDFYAMSNKTISSGKIAGSAITVKDDKISLDYKNDYEVNLTVTKDSSTKVSISVPTGYIRYSGPSTNLEIGTPSYEWKASVANNCGTFNFSTGTRSLAFTTSSEGFKAYLSITEGTYLNLELYKYVGETKETFAQAIMNHIHCDSTGVTGPTFDAGYEWSDLSIIFAKLASNDKEYLQNSTADESSTNIIEKAMYRYDYIVAKYSAYEDFISRNPSMLFYDFVINTNDEETSVLLPIIVVISLAALTSLGMCLYIKKRKHEIN